MKSLRYILLLISIALISCEERIDWNFGNTQSELIIVEAVITNENIQQLVKLSRPYSQQNMQPSPISGASVVIRSNSEFYQLAENPIGSGQYYSVPFIAVTGKIYELVIDHDSRRYTALATQPPVEPLPDLEIYAASDSTYAINFRESGTEPNYIQHFIDWQNTENCNSADTCLAKVIYYDLKNIDVNKQFSENKEVVTFPPGATIIRKKYSVSSAYREYLRGILSETYWRGGLFDVFPANATTNLSDGAIGFFAASSVVSDTTVVQ